MAFEHTWRWFGPQDPITLAEIKQTGATGIVTALHDVPAGTAWPVRNIEERKNLILREGLTWSVAESVPVHEEIKKRTGGYKQKIENYKESIRNLGRYGIDTVCYNFMPVLDWSRTNLDIVFKDGSITTGFQFVEFAVFDLFLLERTGAEKNYSPEVRKQAETLFRTFTESNKQRLIQTILLGFPGSGETYTLSQFRDAIAGYDSMGSKELRNHLKEFLKEVIPAAEEAGVRMAIHPDDPPWPLLGLPRIVSSAADVREILETVDSPSNGLTLCTGSFGASKDNDLVSMAKQFASKIHFAHLRNVSRRGERDFTEDNHLEGDVDLAGVMKELILEQRRRQREETNPRRIPMRPDHGHLMIADKLKPKVYPGYSLFGRMRALAELRGLELGIERSLA